jgi:single-stranded-DNA-specific exonuclease
MVEGLRRCAGSLEKFGGHEYAGGLSILPERVAQFTEQFENAARQALAPEQLVRRLDIDAELEFSAIDMALTRQLEVLQPFGVGNPEPLFASAGVEVCERKAFSAGVRYRLRHCGRVIGGVIFGVGDDYPGMPGETVDVAYRLTETQWNGASRVELKIADLRVAESAAPVSRFAAPVSAQSQSS